MHTPSAAQSWVQRVQRPVLFGKAPCGISVVVDQGNKGETQSAMIPLLSVQLWPHWIFGAGMGSLVEPFLRLLDLALSPAAARFTERQKISYAVI